MNYFLLPSGHCCSKDKIWNRLPKQTDRSQNHFAPSIIHHKIPSFHDSVLKVGNFESLVAVDPRFCLKPTRKWPNQPEARAPPPQTAVCRTTGSGN
ncbi:hypothetical protein SLE2022_192530 [Rubroshorea leprosula]